MPSGYAAMLQGTMLQVGKSNDVERKLDQIVELHTYDEIILQESLTNVAQSGPIQ